MTESVAPDLDRPERHEGRTGNETTAALRARGSTKRAIELAAAHLFRRDGFAATTVRGIAAEAGANPALVIRHFGSKEALFLEVMTLTPPSSDPVADPASSATGRRRSSLVAATQGPVDELGRQLAAYVLDEVASERSEVRDVYRALSRALDIPEVRDRLREVVDQHLVEPLAARFTGPRGRIHAGLVAVQLSGLMAAVWGAEDELLTTMGRDEIVNLYGGALQHIIDAGAVEDR